MKLNILAFAVALTLATNLICRADPLDTWTWRNPLPLEESFVSMTYGNGLYAGIVINGSDFEAGVYTSLDGTNWNLSLWGMNTSLSSIAYGNGLFMVMGCTNGLWNGLIWTSSDGINWTNHAIPMLGGVYVYYDSSFVAYGNGKYVVVGYALDKYDNPYPVILSSQNLITWIQTVPALPGASSISYGNGRFVIGSNGGTWTSTDGINWMQGDLGTNNFGPITFGNDMFVGVGNYWISYGEGVETIFVSQDGANWFQASMPVTITNVSIQSVTYANNIFVAVGSHILTSPDGINWTVRYTNSRPLLTITFGRNGFVASGSGGTGGPGAILLNSPDGINWTQYSSTATTANLNDVAFGNGLFAAVGSGSYSSGGYSSGGTIIATSSDATTWTSHNFNGYGFLNRVIYGGNQFVAVGNGGTILTSTNGINWSSRNPGVTYSLFDVAYGNGVYDVIGFNGILSSTNGINWTTNYSGYFRYVHSIAYGNGQFVAFGNTNILSSVDGVNWTIRRPLPISVQSISSLCFGNASFVALFCANFPIGNGAFILSDDLEINYASSIIMSNVAYGVSGDNITYGNGQFVACLGQAVITSTDGLNWKQRTPLFAGLNGVAYGEGHFVAVGQAGTILESGQITLNPYITTQPQSQMIQSGSNVSFTVAADGASPLGYQWQFNGQNLDGQIAASLSLTNVQFANAGGYSVVVTNAYGSTNSAVAQLMVFTNLVVTQTNKAPPLPGNPTIPTDATHFKVLTNGGFVTGIGLNPSKSTIVITHGWKDSSLNYTDWPQEIANDIKLVLGASTPNIVAWDWTAEAKDTLTAAASKTLGQGYALGTNLVAALGTNYSMRIHFIGHSLGTMVNAKAANIVHSKGFLPANTQMTLFDEASIASGLMADSWQTATTLLQNDANPQLTLQPVLPAQFAWADNYITAFGLPHTNAVNVILTNEYPVINNSVIGDIANVIWQNFLTEDTSYHHYPHVWYFNTINQINNPADPPYLMGFQRSWEGGGYAGRPSTNTYYIESANCPPSFPSYSGYDPAYNLVQISSNQASQFLNDRLKTILPQHLVSAVSASQNVLANAPNQVHAMLASGQILDPAADEEFLLQYGAATIVQFGTTQLAGSLVVKGAAQPQGGPVPNGTGNNSPAYVWLTLSVPSNSVAMSFDFMLQGNGNQDSFQAALNNQNIFTLETVLIQTNVGMNSGMIDVSQYAGQQVQLFLGIVGGTSTNATATVGNILFYSAAPPTLQIQLAGTNVMLSWPLWAATYSLEKTGTLGTTNSWMVVTNVPSIVNSQCTVTNQISGKSSYYRLAIIATPALQAQVSGKNFILSWPASATGYGLETSTNLADANSWIAVTNTPATVNQQSVVTNQISGAARFYRLKQQ
jgi:hypothetical protein